MENLLREKRKLGLKEEVSDREKAMLLDGVPIQKIIGFINFDDLDIKVNKHVLIPRYETVEVLEKALEFINKDSSVLDLCTGSGYIGLSIKHKTNAQVTVSDISDEAIAQASINAVDNNLDVNIIKSNMFENIKGKFDVIISNPPYIPAGTRLAPSVINHEPLNALFAGEDGNDFYKIICEGGPDFLNEGGVIVLEISEDNKEYIESQGFTILKDINGKNRIAFKKY